VLLPQVYERKRQSPTYFWRAVLNRLTCCQAIGETPLRRALDSGGSGDGTQHLSPHDPPESNALEYLVQMIMSETCQRRLC
jgi:hypothetical protein